MANGFAGRFRMPKHKADIISTNHGSIISLTAGTKRGRAWMRDHVLAEGRGETVHCEHRYGIDILQGAKADGLRLQDSSSGKMAE
jgi:hypothetical protein